MDLTPKPEPIRQNRRDDALSSASETLGAESADRQALVEWFDRTRARSRQLFDLLVPEAYYTRPIALRHPIVFYEGHLAAFAVNTILRKALGRDGLDPELDVLFARGIDPEDETQAAARTIQSWPMRDDVQAYADRADRAVRQAVLGADLHRPSELGVTPLNAFYTVVEHEVMHQETLLYIWHRLPHALKVPPADANVGSRHAGNGPEAGAAGHGHRHPGSAEAGLRQMDPSQRVRIPAGCVTLGADPGDLAFGWDNEFSRLRVDVPSFEIDVFDVTNAAFLEFVEAGGYTKRELWSPEGWAWLQADHHRHPLFWERHDEAWHWRGQFELFALPPDWPVFVSHAEASAYAKWKGRRLPTEAEFHRAAYGTPSGDERRYPWGDQPADSTRGNFDFARWDPSPVGHHPLGASAWGIHDLVGNGWEWTSTVFAPFPGFAAMPSYPEYSADFFDGRHYVMKGASPVTARELLRPSFRNWFRPEYPYVYATFRCV